MKDYWKNTCLVVKLAAGKTGIQFAKFLHNWCPNSNSVQGLGAADNWMMVIIIHLAPGSILPAVHTIRNRLGGPYPWSFP